MNDTAHQLAYLARTEGMSLTEWFYADGSKYQFILSAPRQLDVEAIQWLLKHLNAALAQHQQIETAHITLAQLHRDRSMALSR